MDCMGMGLDGEWESLSRMLTFEYDEPNFEPHFVTFPSDDEFLHNNALNFSFSNNQDFVFSYDNSHVDLSPSNEFAFPRNVCIFEQGNETTRVSPFEPNDLINEPELAEGSGQSAYVEMKRKYNNTSEVEATAKTSSGSLATTPTKKARMSKYRAKKTVQSDLQIEEAEVDNTTVESSSHCATRENSDDESNASRDNSDGGYSASKEPVGVTLKGNKRASRGEATDPQSLYARRRRQRINERLRILQNLVPNGTKVDISTMLEEAVHYVKFLQLQLKLLSSDDLWMYAPIAYNGVDISLCREISPFLLH